MSVATPTVTAPAEVQNDKVAATDSDDKQDFDWLEWSLEYGNSILHLNVVSLKWSNLQVPLADSCFTRIISWDDRPTTSVDIGANGYTASLSHSHRLLQMTAPDPDHGLIFVRGEFPDYAGSLSARSQGSVNSGTWGFEFKDDSELQFRDLDGQGFINYRWPYFNYELTREELDSGGDEADDVVRGKRGAIRTTAGSMFICAFIMEDSLFIVRRIQLDPVDTEKDQGKGHKAKSMTHKIRFRVGGLLRFGKASYYQGYRGRDQIASNAGVNPTSTEFPTAQSEYAKFGTQLFVDGVRQIGIQDRQEVTELGFDLDVDVPKGGQTVIVEVNTLRSKRFKDPTAAKALPTSSSIRAYLGITPESPNATAALWSTLQGDRGDSEETTEIAAIARCVERILHVSSVPEYPSLRNKLDGRGRMIHSPGISSSSPAPSMTLAADAVSGTGSKDGTKGEEQSREAHNINEAASLSATTEPKKIHAPADLPVTSHVPPTGAPLMTNPTDAIRSTGPSLLAVSAPPASMSPMPSPGTEQVVHSGDPLATKGEDPEILSEADRRAVSRIQRSWRLQRAVKPLRQVRKKVVIIQNLQRGRMARKAYKLLRDPKGFALVRNIMTRQYVDLKSAFWQLRLLATAHRLLSAAYRRQRETNIRSDGTADRNNDSASKLDEAWSCYLNTIQERLQQLLVWFMENEYMTQANRMSPLIRASMPFFDDELADSKKGDEAGLEAYRALSIWVVRHHCPHIFDEHQTLNKMLKVFLDKSWEKYPKQAFSRTSRVQADQRSALRSALLKWYHNACLQSLLESTPEDSKEGLLDVSQNSTSEVAPVMQRDDEQKPPGSTNMGIGFGGSSASIQTKETHRKPELTKSVIKESVEHFAKAWRTQAEGLFLSLLREPLEDRLDTYFAQDEMIDRLALLSDDLGLGTPSKGSETSCRHLALRRIKDRKPTEELYSSQTETSNWEPWELKCLNHHNRWVASWFPDGREAALGNDKENCFEFLQPDFNFVASWDRSNSYIVEEWFDVETSSVICTTLVGIKMASVERIAADSENAQQEKSLPGKTESITGDEGRSKVIQDVEQTKLILESLQQTLHEMVGKPAPEKLFKWTDYRPSEIHFPGFMTQSLDDTPQRYSEERLAKVELRSEISRYLEDSERRESKRPTSLTTTSGSLWSPYRKAQKIHQRREGWSLKNIESRLPESEVLYLSLFDLDHDRRRIWLNDLSLSYHSYGVLTLDPGSNDADDKDASYGREVAKAIAALSDDTETERVSLWHCFLEGSPEVHSLFPKLDASVKQKMRDKSEIAKWRKWYRRKLFQRLTDSMIDKAINHRLLFATRCSPRIVQAFIDMWHSDAMDAFDAHVGSTFASRFIDSQEGNSNLTSRDDETERPWTTSITIFHWEFIESSLPEGIATLFNEEQRPEIAFPPANVPQNKITKKRMAAAKAESSNKRESQTKYLRERSSTIAITSDTMGTFWTCSVLTSSISVEVMSALAEDLVTPLEIFLHQRSTGRQLVFLSLLGHLCENVAKGYDEILKKVDDAVGSTRQIMFEGFEVNRRDASEEALNSLMDMLWGLETLRNLNNTLLASLSEIRNAQESVYKYVKWDRQLWSRKLTEEFEKKADEFQKRYERLRGVQEKTQMKIEGIQQYRDGISAVANLNESHTTVKQGDNIKILTYITIGYLPLGFVTALFSMNGTITVSSNHKHLFIGLIFAFLVSTFTLASLLSPIEKFWGRTMDQLKPKRRARRSEFLEKPKESSAAGRRGSVGGASSTWRSMRQYPLNGRVDESMIEKGMSPGLNRPKSESSLTKRVAAGVTSVAV